MPRSHTLVGAIDQGTSSSRFLVFDVATKKVVASHQEELRQTFPKEGWVEMDPMQILYSVCKCIDTVAQALVDKQIDPRECIQSIGITNQRETTIVWSRKTGDALHPAIVWLDARTQATVRELVAKCPGKDKFAFSSKCGLPISTYFSAIKLRWLLDNVPEVMEAGRCGDLMFGTVDTWLLWHLTGMRAHVTDVTNASRTMLMNLRTLEWDPELCKFFAIDLNWLPSIKSSSEVYGTMNAGSLKGIRLAGCLGDQQASLVGNKCFEPGQAKNTYGTGLFLLYNTGATPHFSRHGLVTTVAYKLGPHTPAMYALEGSVAIGGALVRWLRDSLGIIKSAEEVERLAGEVEDSGGVVFVPAFSGLFAPHWDTQARGAILGMSLHTDTRHIARAALEAIALQSAEVLHAMDQDSGNSLRLLNVDGGASNNCLLMQLQADLAGIDVFKPDMVEMTALGAAIAAGLAVGVWDQGSTDVPGKTFHPILSETARCKRVAKWSKAVERSKGWED